MKVVYLALCQLVLWKLGHVSHMMSKSMLSFHQYKHQCKAKKKWQDQKERKNQSSSNLVVLSEEDEARSLCFLVSSQVSLWLCVSDTGSWSTPAEQYRNAHVGSNVQYRNSDVTSSVLYLGYYFPRWPTWLPLFVSSTINCNCISSQEFRSYSLGVKCTHALLSGDAVYK